LEERKAAHEESGYAVAPQAHHREPRGAYWVALPSLFSSMDVPCSLVLLELAGPFTGLPVLNF